MHTPKGTYIQDPARIASLVFVAPDLTNTKLRPYVSTQTRQQSKKHKDAVQRQWMMEELAAADLTRARNQGGIEQPLEDEAAPNAEAAPFVEGTKQ